LKKYPIFRLNDVFKWFPKQNRRALIFQLSFWTKKGYLERLKRGVLFFGYQIVKPDFLYSYKIAIPEKALFDFIYLESLRKGFNPETYLSEARFHFDKNFKWRKLKQWQKLVPKNKKKFHLALKNLFKVSI